MSHGLHRSHICAVCVVQEERAPLTPIVNGSFPVLLGLMQQLVADSSSTQQVAEFMKLICKVQAAVCCHRIASRPTVQLVVAQWQHRLFGYIGNIACSPSASASANSCSLAYPWLNEYSMARRVNMQPPGANCRYNHRVSQLGVFAPVADLLERHLHGRARYAAAAGAVQRVDDVLTSGHEATPAMGELG